MADKYRANVGSVFFWSLVLCLLLFIAAYVIG